MTALTDGKDMMVSGTLLGTYTVSYQAALAVGARFDITGKLFRVTT